MLRGPNILANPCSFDAPAMHAQSPYPNDLLKSLSTTRLNAQLAGSTPAELQRVYKHKNIVWLLFQEMLLHPEDSREWTECAA